MAIDAYLQIEGIKGESADSAHPGWIEVTGINWGVHQPRSATASTGGGHTAERDPATFNFMSGDVMVMEPHKGGSKAGHVAGYDGSRWVSDFVQNDFWAGPGYRTEKPHYVVYRY